MRLLLVNETYVSFWLLLLANEPNARSVFAFVPVTPKL